MAEISDADIKYSQSLGLYGMKIDNRDKKINASPNWVRLYSVLGNCDKVALRKKKPCF